MVSRLDLIKRAQVRIGDEPLTAETDAGADTYTLIFDSVRDYLLSVHPWTWATVTRRLTRLAAVPGAHWSYYYQLPSDMLGAPRAVYDNSTARIPFTGYELSENRLASNAGEIWLRYAKRPEAALWPGYFVELITVALASELALAVREDKGLYTQLREIAYGAEHMNGHGGLMQQAASADTQASPSPVIGEGNNPLVSVRY